MTERVLQCNEIAQFETRYGTVTCVCDLPAGHVGTHLDKMAEREWPH